MMSGQQTVTERIRWCEAEAQRLSTSADGLRWEAAELIAAELESGKTQRQLAEEIGKSVMHVNYMNKVWAVHHGVQDGSRSFDSYYQEVKRATSGVDESELTSSPQPQSPAPSLSSKASSPLPSGDDDAPIRAPGLPPVCRAKDIREEIITRLAFPEKELVAICNEGLTVDELYLVHEVLRRLLDEIESLIHKSQ
jgi:hypothetical protein